MPLFETRNDLLNRLAVRERLHRLVDRRLAGFRIEAGRPVDALDERDGIEEMPVGAIDRVEISVPIETTAGFSVSRRSLCR